MLQFGKIIVVIDYANAGNEGLFASQSRRNRPAISSERINADQESRIINARSSQQNSLSHQKDCVSVCLLI